MKSKIMQEFEEKFANEHVGESTDGVSCTLREDYTSLYNRLEQFLSSAIDRAVVAYDSELFDDDSCYKTVGVWKNRRDEALAKYMEEKNDQAN